MKNKIISGIIVVASALLSPPAAQSQGSVYVSSLAAPSAGSPVVASDSWLAEEFQTGNNPSGYALDSIQLDMAPASGTPDGFAVMLYSEVALARPLPGVSLGTLSGLSDPVAGGLYTYSASGLTLAPSTDYYIVLKGGSAVASGAFAWNIENTTVPSASGGWLGGGNFGQSSDGSTWTFDPGIPQYAVTATAVPEPDTLVLLSLPGLLFFARRLWHGKERRAAAK